METKKQFTVKHYIYLLIWCLSMGYALDKNTVLLGLFLAAAFFFITTFKVLGKLFILMIAVFILTAIFPPLAVLIAIASFIFFLLRIKFVIDNWRALAVGMYAYGVYLIVVLFNNFFYDHVVVQTAGAIFQFFQEGSPEAVSMIGQEGVEASRSLQYYGTTAVHVASYLVPIPLTVIFHLLLCWLYKHEYSTNRAFYVMGLTPLIMMAFILPFLKIDINGHEIFHGSFSNGIDGVEGSEKLSGSLSLKGDIEVPSDVNAMLDYADIDIGGWLDNHSQEFSPAIEASLASAAARGVYAVDAYLKRTGEVYTIKDETGASQTVSYINENIAVIKDSLGKKIGSISSDNKGDTEIVNLPNGLIFTIDRKTGNILDKAGKLLGKIKEQINGDKLLLNNNGEVVRKYRADGSITNADDGMVGNIAIA